MVKFVFSTPSYFRLESFKVSIDLIVDQCHRCVIVIVDLKFLQLFTLELSAEHQYVHAACIYICPRTMCPFLCARIYIHAFEHDREVFCILFV